MALQAGASGLQFTPVPGLIGSDLMRVRDDFRIIASPYDEGEPVAVIPAITPDVALVHARRASRDGTLVIPAEGDTHLLIRASRRTVATTEEIVDGPITTLAADELLVPGIYVDVLAHAPGGARPLACPGYYEADAAAITDYVHAAADLSRFTAWLTGFVAAGRPAGDGSLEAVR